jgi:hypothetical protein
LGRIYQGGGGGQPFFVTADWEKNPSWNSTSFWIIIDFVDSTRFQIRNDRKYFL